MIGEGEGRMLYLKNVCKRTPCGAHGQAHQHRPVRIRHDGIRSQVLGSAKPTRERGSFEASEPKHFAQTVESLRKTFGGQWRSVRPDFGKNCIEKTSKNSFSKRIKFALMKQRPTARSECVERGGWTEILKENRRKRKRIAGVGARSGCSTWPVEYHSRKGSKNPRNNFAPNSSPPPPTPVA